MMNKGCDEKDEKKTKGKWWVEPNQEGRMCRWEKKNEAASEDKDEKDRSLSSPSFEDQMKNCPTYNLLSLMERQLCASMHMKPGFYLTIKTIVLKDNLLRRQGVQVKTRYPPNLDKTHRKHIMNFLKESGWVATS